MQFKKLIFLGSLFLLFSYTANAQLSKGSFLIGGTANGSLSLDSNVDGLQTNSFSWSLNPNTGYFFKDKLAAGLRINTGRGWTPVASSFYYNVSPFLRYYFLPQDKKWNLIGETSFAYGQLFTDDVTDKYINLGFSAGPVFFIRPNLGLEMLINYNQNLQGQNRLRFNTSIGLQWYFNR